MRRRMILAVIWLAGLTAVLYAIPARPRLVLPPDQRFGGFTPDGRRFATVQSFDSQPDPNVGASLWDVDTGRLVGTLRGPWPVYRLIFSADGRRAASFYTSPAVLSPLHLMAWDQAPDGSFGDPFLAEFPIYGMFGRPLLFLPGEQAMLVTSTDHVTLWNPPDQPPRPMPLEALGENSRLVNWALSADGSRIVAAWIEIGGGWPTIAVHEMRTGRAVVKRELLQERDKPPISPGRHGAVVLKLDIAPDGRTLAIAGQTTSNREFVSIWDVNSGREIAMLPWLRLPEFTADGRTLVAVRQTTNDDELTAYDLNAERERVVASFLRTITGGGMTPATGWYALRRDWIVWPTRLSDGRVLALRTADPPENTVADKFAAWSDRFLHRPIRPHYDARLIDALTGQELAAVPAGGANAIFAPNGRTFAQEVEMSYAPQPVEFPFALWDLPPRQPIVLLLGGAAVWTLLFLAATRLVRWLRDRRTRRRETRSSAVEAATGI
jgi:hypothetical protein